MSRKRILPQMFDVRPVDETGDLDWKKIKNVGIAAKPEKSTSESVVISEDVIYEADVHSGEERKVMMALEERIKKLEAELKRVAELKIQQQEDTRSLEKQESIISQQENFLIIERMKKERKDELEQVWKISTKEAAKKEKEALKEAAKKRMLEERKVFLEEKKEKLLIDDKSVFAGASYLRTKKIKDKSGSGLFGGLFSGKKTYVEGGSYQSKGQLLSFASMVAAVAILVGGVSFVYKGLSVKSKVLGVSQRAYSSMSKAVSDISSQNFNESSQNFEEAFSAFSEASSEIDKMGSVLNEGSKYFPYFSKLSSGKNILEAGKHLSLAGKHASETVEYFNSLKNSNVSMSEVSFLDVMKKLEEPMIIFEKELSLANEDLDGVNVDDLPEEMRNDFVLLKKNLPHVTSMAQAFIDNEHILADILGANGPRKYLFLFQNNNEMRATGGFIGSYGLLDISNGRIRNFFIDGIFNPDGQLKEKIVPPRPIQKISVAWSLHDSNWFPDFPTSAKEAILFYEKTGGPTVDGVIAITPAVMEKLLKISGPINMEEYGVILDSENFIEETQDEVEGQGQENLKVMQAGEDQEIKTREPKKILADLAPKVLDKVFNSGDNVMMLKAVEVLLESLSEKHFLLYSQNAELQKLISQKRWSGEILDSKKDYLSVINTNINGYKTDGVIDEEIDHKIKIKDDGSVSAEVSITRKHNGGNSKYSWWNKVNADYMRVYVPLGSKLRKVEGQTREINQPPLDYDKLGFKRNPLIQKEEDSMLLDEETGTRIYEDAGKTVFANWTYVSPQETMTITYEYDLPFNVFDQEGDAGSYSLVAQKQSGSAGSAFKESISIPDEYVVEWKTPQDMNERNGDIEYSGNLVTDEFVAVVLKKKE